MVFPPSNDHLKTGFNLCVGGFGACACVGVLCKEKEEAGEVLEKRLCKKGWGNDENGPNEKEKTEGGH